MLHVLNYYNVKHVGNRETPDYQIGGESIKLLLITNKHFDICH